MQVSTPSAPAIAPTSLASALREQGFAVLDATGVCALTNCQLQTLAQLQPFWNDLPPDKFLKDGGRYRRRRHSCFVLQGEQLAQVPHRAHWQPVEYNALHGGMQRWFEPILPELLVHPAWRQVLLWLGHVCSELKGAQPWFVEAHQFRIDTTDGIGRPTPEGAHRDGVDMVAVFLIDRVGIKGGETRVFEADGHSGQRFTLTQPWSVLLLDDARVIHESTPIQPLVPGSGDAHRDTLVITLKAGHFQSETAELD